MRFPEFKDEWKICTISDFGKIITGSTPSTKDTSLYGEEYLWASPSDLGTNKFITETNTKLSQKGFEKSRKLPKDSILVTCIGSTIGKMGMASRDMATNQQINAIIVNKDVDCHFAYYAIQSSFPRYMLSVAVQAVPIISKSNFEKLCNYRPTTEEQKKIGALLSLIDKRIEIQKSVIEKLKSLKSAIVDQMIKKNTALSKDFKVSEIAEIGRGRVISTKEINSQQNPKYPVYSSQTSNNGVMGYLDNYSFDGEFITWTTDGANAGTVFYRNGKFNCTNVCGVLKLKNNFDAYYVSQILQRATHAYVSTNLANPKLMNNTMAQVRVSIPSYENQLKWSKLLKAIDKELEIMEKGFFQVQVQKRYLLSKMFI